jgi:16S rRNA (guanine527-N7)-methyltransferase
MTNVDLIFKHFPDLTNLQKDQFSKLKEVYTFWNEQINVISRKDLDQFYERHVLHSLAIAKVQNFKDGSRILDIGTGGGFPGVPLAILFPNCQFVLVDSIGKKIKVVNEVCETLQINNITTHHARAEDIKEQFDFIVSRAVTAMPAFLKWVKGKFLEENKNKLRNGILYLKGGDLNEEMKPLKQKIKYNDISKFFDYDFFETKKVVYLDMNKR